MALASSSKCVLIILVVSSIFTYLMLSLLLEAGHLLPMDYVAMLTHWDKQITINYNNRFDDAFPLG